MRKILSAIPCFLLLLGKQGFSQTMLTGQVMNEDSIPLPAVSVLNKRDKTSTISDNKGVYMLPVRKGDTVLLKAIGYVPLLYIAGDKRVKVFHRLQRQPIELNTVNIRHYSFFKDSLAFRDEYRKDFSARRPRWYEVYQGLSVNIHNLYSAMSFKENRRKEKFKRTLLTKEQDNFIDSRFSADVIIKITNLHGDSLTQFMETYRPTYTFIKNATEYDLYEFIKNNYLKYTGKQPAF